MRYLPWRISGTYLGGLQLRGNLSLPDDRRQEGRSLDRGHLHGLALLADRAPGRGWFRAGGQVTVRIREPVADPETVTCVIPGHHQQGREVIADRLAVADGTLDFELSGKCGYESGFAYSSEDA